MSEIEVIRGSGNVWRDLGYADADVREIKSQLACKIIVLLEQRGLSDRAAAKELEGIDHSDISRIRNVDLKRYTVDRLMRVLIQMNCRIDVGVTAPRQRRQSSKTKAHVSAG